MIDAIFGSMNRAKVSVTLDPELLGMVDAFVESHPGQDRSKVIDQALKHWHARLQEIAMEAQYTKPAEPEVRERTAWRAIRRSAVKRRLSRP
jgi:Arc/MetJ-type ribon-helix-helix transcriptional regulator